MVTIARVKRVYRSDGSIFYLSKDWTMTRYYDYDEPVTLTVDDFDGDWVDDNDLRSR